ncbi:unnamed protein product, partial [Timema podura]|nr:unnamed protein product [Timema podura]
MIGVISNLMNVNDTVLVECDKNETITQSLVEVVHKYVRMVSLPLGEELVISTENIALKAMDVTFEEKYLVQGISFFPRHSKRLSNLEMTTASSEENLDALSKEDCYDASINIPGEALLLASKRMSNVRVQFVSYQNGKFFRTSNSEAEINKTIVKKTYKMYQHIITAAIKNVFVENLTETVRYSLPNLGGSHKQVCVYWNPESQEWLQDGIIIVNHSDLVVSCESTHMTAFSVLLDPSPNEPLPANHEFILTIISYIGSTLSIFGLIFTILTYSIFRCLNRDRSGKILLNLCISLLFMNVAFLLLALKDDMVRFDVCMGIAVATHFFLLSSLMWMCVEALNMYQMIIMVFATSETHFMLKRMVCAWGLPVIIVSSTVIYDIAFYQSVESKYCFIRPRDQLVYNITYFGPACCLLAINVVVFVLVARVLFRNKMAGKMGSNSESGITMAQIRGAFTVMTLLGVTWTFGAFAFGTFKKRRGPLPSSSTANSNSRHTIMSSTHSQSTRKTSLHNNGLENRKHSSFWKRFRSFFENLSAMRNSRHPDGSLCLLALNRSLTNYTIFDPRRLVS